MSSIALQHAVSGARCRTAADVKRLTTAQCEVLLLVQVFP